MGNIIQILDSLTLSDSPTLQASRMTVEKCENIHIHYRNQRLEFSKEEFEFYVDKLIEAKEKLKTAPEETDFYSLVASLDLKEDPEFYPKRLQIEANVGGIHLHYKNIRLELTKDEFKVYGNSIAKALKNLKEVKPFKVKEIPLTDINPYDGGHTIDPEDNMKFICHNQKEHEEHIEKIKNKIKEGKWIRPIAVSTEGPPYQRMDGFCRYMAHKQLGREAIEAIICPLTFAGCQDKKSIIISSEEYQKILNGETY